MTTPTQGEHAQTALANELFAAAQLAPGEGIEDAVRRIAAALTEAPAQPAAPQGVAYAELPPRSELGMGLMSEPVEGFTADDMRSYADATHALRASHGQAPAGAAPNPWREHLAEQADVIYCNALQRAMVKHGISFPEGGMDHFRASLGEMVNRFVRFAAPTAQAAPAAGITVEQVEDAIGLQSTAWDTIGAEKIVEAVLRLANAKAPAAGAVAGPVAAGMVPVAEVVECGTMGQQTLREIDGRWRWLSIGEHLYAQADTGFIAAPTPAAQADSVLEDAARLDFLCSTGKVRMIECEQKGLWRVYQDEAPPDAAQHHWQAMASEWYGTPRAAIDAARKQGGKHD